MSLSERVRHLWIAFEQWLVGPRAAMERRREEIFNCMDSDWKTTPSRSRVPREVLEVEKRARLRDLEEELVVLARLEWQKRLTEAGLRDEDWTDMTFAETLAVERALASDLDEEGMAIMENVAYRDAQPQGDNTLRPAPQAPQAPSTLPRTSSISTSYAFVSPTTLGVEEEGSNDGGTSSFEAIFPFDMPAQEDDVNVDAIIGGPATYNMWEGPSSTYNSLPQIDQRVQIETPAYRTWAKETARSSQTSQLTSQSSRSTSQSSKAPSQNSQTASPEQLPTKFVPVVAEYPYTYPYTATPLQTQAQIQPQPQISSQLRAPEAAPPERTVDNKPLRDRLPGQRYFGPKLSDPAEPTCEAAEFEKFKMDTRVAKIWEFHNEAAHADITLAFEISNMQKERSEARIIKEQEKRMLEEHNARMVELQRAKEQERKVIVEQERQKRLEEIRQREEKRKRTEEVAQAARVLGLESLIEGQPAMFDIDRLERWAAQQEVEGKSRGRHGSTMSKRVSVSGNDGQPESARALRRERRHSQSVDSHAQAATAPTFKNNTSNPTAVPRPHSNGNKSSRQMQGPDLQAQAPGPVVEQTSFSSQSSKPSHPPIRQGQPQNREYWVPRGLEAKTATVSSSRTQSQAPAAEAATQPQSADALRMTPDQIQTSSSGLRQSQAVPSKKQQSRVIETQTQGASSSRTTLDQLGPTSGSRPRLDDQSIRVPAAELQSNVKPPLVTQAPFSGSEQPPVLPDRRQFWVPPAEAKAMLGPLSSKKASDSPAPSRSPQIEKSRSMPEPQRIHPSTEAKRLRRMSDPVSPSPRGFVERGRDEGKGPDIVQGILKNSKTKASTKTGKPPRPKRVTVEEVSDEDGPALQKGKGHNREDHPSDSNVIMEPKPNVPSTMYAQIFQYGADAGGRGKTSMTPGFSSNPRNATLSTATTSLPNSSSSSGDGFTQGPIGSESKNSSSEWDILHRGQKTSKAKHVRWTPSVLAGGSPNAQTQTPSVDPFELFNEGVPGNPITVKRGMPRSRVTSLVQDTVESSHTDWKRKGKEKIGPQDSGDELTWYAMEAIESLRQVRSKPASAV